jgi:hypothetical protein
VGCSSQLVLLFALLHIVMRIGPDVLILNDIFGGHLAVGCSSQLVLLFALLHIVMRIGPDVLILSSLSRVGACFLVIL